MFRNLTTAIVLAFSISVLCAAQNSNTSTTSTRERTTTSQTTTTQPQKPASSSTKEGTKSTTTSGQTTKSKQTTTGKNGSPAAAAQDPTSGGVTAAFNALVDGIRHANLKEVTSVYWDSPQLVLFNSNGTVTRGWDQLRANRESSYPNLKDVKLDVRDVKVQMLGRDGAVVTCLWTQSQTVKGAPESASGRMTLVFRRVGNAWKVVHLHTSPDMPDPSRILPSEQAEKPVTTPKP
jgi:ketosteroid isomerase-like protein